MLCLSCVFPFLLGSVLLATEVLLAHLLYSPVLVLESAISLRNMRNKDLNDMEICVYIYYLCGHVFLLIFLTVIPMLIMCAQWLSHVWLFVNRMNCSLVGFPVQARILEWVAISYSMGSSWPRVLTCISCISCIGRCILYHCTTWEAPSVKNSKLNMSSYYCLKF